MCPKHRIVVAWDRREEARRDRDILFCVEHNSSGKE